MKGDMLARLHPSLLISLSWVALALFFTGLGDWVRSLLKRPVREQAPSWAFGVGFSLFLLLAQAVNLGLPLRYYLYVPLAPLAIWGLGVRYDFWPRGRRPAWGALAGDLTILAGLCIPLSRWVLYQGIPYDDGLYHLQTIRWLRSYPLPPGLGNLHGRLAFNSAYLCYAATLWELPGLALRHLANGPLTLALLLETLKSLGRLIRGEGKGVPDLLAVFISPYVVRFAATYLNNVSADAGVFILSVGGLWGLARYLQEGEEADLGLLLLICAAGITVKLSFVGLGVAIALIALAWRTWRLHRGIKGLFALWAAPTAMLSVWVARSVIASGYLVYPVAWTGLPVDWRIPRDLVVEEANWVRSWARSAEAHWSVVLSNWDWFGPWLRRTLGDQFDVTWPLGLAGVGLAAALSFFKRWERATRLEFWASLVPPVANILYWFITAPGARFCKGLFWFLFASIGAWLFEKGHWANREVRYQVAFLIALYLWMPTLRDVAFSYNAAVMPQTPVVATERFTTDSGLTLYVPATGNQCWDSPLPCTPYPNAALRLRRPGDLRSGFTVAPLP